MTSSPTDAPTDAPVRHRADALGLRRYGVILREPAVSGVLGFSVIGRLHESMISFGVIMLVTHRSTYAAAGVVMAAFGTGGLVAGPVNSRLAARFGHVPVLLVTAGLYAAAVLGMAVAGENLLWLGILGACAGTVTPPLTPALRSTLPRLVRPEHRLSVFALESTLQETIFISGPVLAGAMAAVAGPQAALVTAAAATLVGTVGYCAVVRGRSADGRQAGTPLEALSGTARGRAWRGSALLTPVVLRLLVGGAGFLVVLCIGAVAVIAQASGPTAQGSAGVLLGLTSAGSMIGGLVFGARVLATSSLRVRYVVLGAGCALLAVVSVAGAGGPGVGGMVLLGAAALLYGTTIAPVATVLFGRLSDEAGERRATEAFGWMGAAMGVGGVVGDAAGGWLVTAAPPWVAAAVAAAGALVTAAAVPGAAGSAAVPDTAG